MSEGFIDFGFLLLFVYNLYWLTVMSFLESFFLIDCILTKLFTHKIKMNFSSWCGVDIVWCGSYLIKQNLHKKLIDLKLVFI